MYTQMRDTLLITAGIRAGSMWILNMIDIPTGVKGEEEVAKFISEAIDDWICFHSDVNFDEYIEMELLIKYGNSLHKEMI